MDTCAAHLAVGALAACAIGASEPAYGAYTDNIWEKPPGAVEFLPFLWYYCCGDVK